jgi:hypothetical protein
MKHLNTITRRLLLLMFCFSLLQLSCKRFLDKPPLGQVTEDAIANDPQAAVNLVNGAYNALWISDAFGTDVHSLNFVILTEVSSDNADKGSSPNDYPAAAEIDNFSITPGNSILNNVWQGYYQAIARVNQALDRIPISPLEETRKNELSGEVRFLRAYFYFNLVRIFGGVPLLTSVPDPATANSTAFQTRASRDSVYDLIISDLQFAANHLPVKEKTTTGRATRGAAVTLLAKVNMYQGNWQAVYDLTRQVISGETGNYDLYANYANLFREAGENNIESIFEVQTGTNNQCNNAIRQYVVSQGPRAGGQFGWQDLGFGFNTPSGDLAAAYEQGDLRKNATIIFIDTTGTNGTVLWDGFRIPSKDSVENTRYNYKAYHSRIRESNCGNADYLPKNLRLLRFAEVLLMQAEAANELNKPAEALVAVNRVRARARSGAGMLPALTTTDKSALRLLIWKERRVELAMEHDRFFDIVRQGRAAALLQAQGKNFKAGRNELFPIPAAQIQLSGGRLSQNPGY